MTKFTMTVSELIAEYKKSKRKLKLNTFNNATTKNKVILFDKLEKEDQLLREHHDSYFNMPSPFEVELPELPEVEKDEDN